MESGNQTSRHTVNSHHERELPTPPAYTVPVNEAVTGSRGEGRKVSRAAGQVGAVGMCSQSSSHLQGTDESQEEV